MTIKFYTPEFYVLNNFSAHAVEYGGQLYSTSEHAYQAAKCTDSKGREAIQAARSPLQAKQIANVTYKATKDPDWENKKVSVMEAILRAKLAQHSEAADALIRSVGAELVEDSPIDYFWGSGADGSGKKSGLPRLLGM